MRLRTALAAVVAVVGLMPVGTANAETGYAWQDPGNPAARAFTQAAVAQVGLSYCWGGGDADGPTIGDPAISKCGPHTGPGFDCSGLVHYALAQAGMRLTDREAHEFAKLGTTVTEPIPGDLVFYDHEDDGEFDHIAIYLGSRKDNPTGPAQVVEASGQEGYTAPEHLVRIRDYAPDDADLVKRPFTLQPAPQLSATTVADGSVRFDWPDSDGETGYHLSPGANPVAVQADRTSHTITGLPLDSQVCYRVRAYKGSYRYPTEVSDWSAPACAWTRTRPAAPSHVAATATLNTITVSWRDNATNETSYAIAGDLEPATLPPNTVEHTWRGLDPGTRACFTVIAANSAGSSTSDQVCATTPNAGPAAPSHLTAEVLPDGVVHLQWQDNASDETGLLVRRRIGAQYDNRELFTYPNATQTWYWDEPRGVELCYTVAALRHSERSPWSNEACVTITP